MTHSIINKSQLEGALRLDAEYYQSEYLNYLRSINKFQNLRIGECAKVLRGKTPKNYGNFETPIIRSGDLSKFFINENLLFTENKEIFYLNKNDVLISSIGFGSIGKVNIFTKISEKVGTVSEVTVIRDAKINPYYLWAFLSSKFGQFQINREITGATGQLHLNTGNVASIIISKLSKSEENIFETFYLQAESLFNQAKVYYEKAEGLLLRELGLENFNVEGDLSSVINFSDIKEANRFDADYFQPKYANLISQIKKSEHKKLGKVVNFKKGFEPGSEAYQEEGKVFIRVSSLSKEGIKENDQKFLSEELYDQLKNEYNPKAGEILLTKDATPGIAYTVKENIEGIVSGGILRLIPKSEIEPEYLSLCLNSIIGKLQSERDAGGSVIMHWKPEEIKNVFIPILPKQTQQKIAELVRKSHESRKKAKDLLEEAKSKVEEIIEDAS